MNRHTSDWEREVKLLWSWSLIRKIFVHLSLLDAWGSSIMPLPAGIRLTNRPRILTKIQFIVSPFSLSGNQTWNIFVSSQDHQALLLHDNAHMHVHTYKQTNSYTHTPTCTNTHGTHISINEPYCFPSPQHSLGRCQECINSVPPPGLKHHHTLSASFQACFGKPLGTLRNSFSDNLEVFTQVSWEITAWA